MQTSIAQALLGQRVLLGITGGIASYKSAFLARRLVEAGAEVRVVMTAGAEAFITPMTLQALTGHPVHTDLLDPAAEAAMGHIELARWATRMLIAPATANTIARLAHGFADDLLTAVCLAGEAPLYLAPAMNRLMWAHPATQANCRVLEARGATLFGPDEGFQACGETGAGRMLEPDTICERLIAAASGDTAALPLAGLTLLLTAGPTREPIDPVRYISNHSSGKMGYAIAAAAARRGAAVTLVSGPVTLATPPGVARVDVESAEDMRDAVNARVEGADIFIGVAAVADYRAREVSPQKIKKNEATMQLELTKNPDILREVAHRPNPPFCVGFAAETESVEQHARAKLATKRLKLIAANHVARPGEPVFGADRNRIEVYFGDTGHVAIPAASKAEVAERLLDVIEERYRSEQVTRQSDVRVSQQ